MSNKFGEAFAVTVVSPIIDGRTLGMHHAMELRRTLAALGTGANSPFASLGMVHTARLVIVDDVANESFPGIADHLASRYLMLVADVDGDLPTFVSALVQQQPDVVDAIWGHCVGWPGTRNPRAVLNYFRDCFVDTALYFGGYPGATVDAVLRALRQQREFVRFLADTRDLPSGELQLAFRAFRARQEKAPAPAPGTV